LHKKAAKALCAQARKKSWTSAKAPFLIRPLNKTAYARRWCECRDIQPQHPQDGALAQALVNPCLLYRV
jgi:hypothetical protein